MFKKDYLDDKDVCAAIIKAYMNFANSCDVAIENAEGKTYYRSVKLSVGAMLSSLIDLSVNDIVNRHPEMVSLMQSGNVSEEG